ncbi:hypothetical protein C8J57DRAFT_1244903 [Mycena rebaudengoi]|nr:hypothetical protein C8J57DRAFT_1244903 [Mycena rebaudengoi]
MIQHTTQGKLQNGLHEETYKSCQIGDLLESCSLIPLHTPIAMPDSVSTTENKTNSDGGPRLVLEAQPVTSEAGGKDQGEVEHKSPMTYHLKDENAKNPDGMQTAQSLADLSMDRY